MSASPIDIAEIAAARAKEARAAYEAEAIRQYDGSLLELHARGLLYDAAMLDMQRVAELIHDLESSR